MPEKKQFLNLFANRLIGNSFFFVLWISSLKWLFFGHYPSFLLPFTGFLYMNFFVASSVN